MRCGRRSWGIACHNILYEKQNDLRGQKWKMKFTEDTITTAPAKNAPALVKKIGQTTYIVRIHFSKTSKETMSDKIKGMLKNEIQQMGS